MKALMLQLCHPDFLFDSFKALNQQENLQPREAKQGILCGSCYSSQNKNCRRTRPVQGTPHSTENSHTRQSSSSFLLETGFTRYTVRAEFHQYTSAACQKKEITWGACIKQISFPRKQPSKKKNVMLPTGTEQSNCEIYSSIFHLKAHKTQF